MSSDEFEIILVLNGCCEPFKSQIEIYIAKCDIKNMRLVQIDTPGVSNARNVALNYAQGEYICFIDDDDYVSSTYLKDLYLIASCDTIAVSNMVAFCDNDIQNVFLDSDQKFEKYELKKYYYWQIRHFFSGPCMKMIHRSIINGRRFDIRFTNGEDSLFMFLISNNMKYVRFSSKNAIYYRRIRNDSLTTKHKPVSYIFNNRCSLMWNYTRIYFADPIHYNFFFYMTRMLASVRSMLLSFLRRR